MFIFMEFSAINKTKNIVDNPQRNFNTKHSKDPLSVKSTLALFYVSLSFEERKP